MAQVASARARQGDPSSGAEYIHLSGNADRVCRAAEANAKRSAATKTQPRTEEYVGNPWEYVWSLNGQRRDLVADQRYLIWKYCHEQSEEWQKQKARIDETDRRRDRKHKEDGTFVAIDAQTVRKWEKERPAKAELSGTNRGAVARGDQLAREAPDLAEKVRLGELNLPSRRVRMTALCNNCALG